MQAVVTGATGLIGQALIRQLGSGVAVLSRDDGRAQRQLGGVRVHRWAPEGGPAPVEALRGADVVFNLAGEPAADGRWTAEKKRRIRDSRVVGTRHLVAGLAALERASAGAGFGVGGRLLRRSWRRIAGRALVAGAGLPRRRLRRLGARSDGRRAARHPRRVRPHRPRDGDGRRRAREDAPAVPARRRRASRQRPAVDAVDPHRRPRRHPAPRGPVRNVCGGRSTASRPRP